MSQKDIKLSTKQALLIAFVFGVITSGVIFSLTGHLMDSQNSSKTHLEEGSRNGNNKTINKVRQINSNLKVQDPTKFLEGDDPSLGRLNASITMIYWCNFRCGSCEKFEREVLPQLLSKLINRGILRIVFKAYPYRQNNTILGVASECAWNQVNKNNPTAYLNWRKALYSNLTGPEKYETLDLTVENTKLYPTSKKVEGISASQLKTCINKNKNKLQKEVAKDWSQGKNVEPVGHPLFVHYKKGSDIAEAMSGTRPYQAFERILLDWVK